MSVNVRSFAIRAGAANECLRASNDLKRKLESTGDSLSYKLPISLLNQLCDKLSIASDEEMRMASEAQKLASSGTLLQEMRNLAILEVKKVTDKLQNDPSVYGASRIEFLAVSAIEGKYSK